MAGSPRLSDVRAILQGPLPTSFLCLATNGRGRGRGRSDGIGFVVRFSGLLVEVRFWDGDFLGCLPFVFIFIFGDLLELGWNQMDASFFL